MTAPVPDGRQHQRAHQRAKIVRKWANAVATTANVPLSAGEFEHELAGLTDIILTALTTEPFQPDAAIGCGTRLVELSCTGPDSLRSTMDVLGAGLVALPERVDRVIPVLSALASGYSEALRRTTALQQETSQRALLNALGRAHQSLRDVSAQLDQVFAGSANGIALTDQDGRFVRTNPAFGEILGYTSAEFADISVFDIVPSQDAGWVREAFRTLPGSVQRTQRLIRKDGEYAWTHLTLSAATGDIMVTLVEDRTDLNLLQSRMTHMALHDVLTGLPNRQYFTTRLEQVLSTATEVTVYHLDLDGFSAVTRGLGRQAGDLLLIGVAHRLQSLFAWEMVARFGADEFAVLVENPPTDAVRRIQQALGENSACVGVVNQPSVGAAEVLDAAEIALARAKRNGPGQWSLSDPVEDARDRERYRRGLG